MQASNENIAATTTEKPVTAKEEIKQQPISASPSKASNSVVKEIHFLVIIIDFFDKFSHHQYLLLLNQLLLHANQLLQQQTQLIPHKFLV